MRPVRATLGDRFEILSTRRVTPIYRDVQARDLKRDRQVRLWIIEDRLIRENIVRQRFLDAVRAFVDAPVPGGVRLLGAGVVAGTTWLRVDPGETSCLRTRLVHWRPSLSEATSLVGGLVETMMGAHERCWLHGFLTARDVLIGPRGLEISGIGLWSALNRQELLGVLQHERLSLAPEARAGQDFGIGADLYGVAAIAQEVFQVAAGLPMPTLRRRGWNPMLVETIDRLLSHGVAARPGSLQPLATALTLRAPAPPQVTPPPALLGTPPSKALPSVADTDEMNTEAWERPRLPAPPRAATVQRSIEPDQLRALSRGGPPPIPATPEPITALEEPRRVARGTASPPSFAFPDEKTQRPGAPIPRRRTEPPPLPPPPTAPTRRVRTQPGARAASNPGRARTGAPLRRGTHPNIVRR